MQFIDIFGDHIATRAQALKAWSGEGCDVKSFEFSAAKATMFAPNFGVLTYRASYDAKCFGQTFGRSGEAPSTSNMAMLGCGLAVLMCWRELTGRRRPPVN